MPIGLSDYDHLAKAMLSLYNEAEMTMLGRISNRLARGVSSPTQWQLQKLSEVQAVQRELRQSIAKLQQRRIAITKEALDTAYTGGIAGFATEASSAVRRLGLTVVPTASTKIASILLELNTSLDRADRNILRNATDMYTGIVGRASARLATGTITLRQAVKDELNDFAINGIRSFTDRSGRLWDMETYAEMATITAIERATLFGYVDSMIENGFDLAIVSSHAGSCPICAAWQDVVLSVSGKDPDYPSLDDAEGAGLFHPRCLHHLSTYHEGLFKGARNEPSPVEPPSEAYSVRQKQRYYERNVRRWKRRMAVAQDPYDERYAFAKVRHYQQTIRSIVRDYIDIEPIPRKYWREGGAVRLSDAARRIRPVTLPR